MKVIDLLNNIANGEEVPKKIKYCDEIYNRTKVIKDNGDYWWNYINSDTTCLLFDNSELNNEVEIIEDTPKEDKKIEKLPYYSLEKIQKAKNKDEWRDEIISLLEKRINDYHNKLNEIIDKINGEE